MALITLRDVTIAFEGVPAVEHVSFQIDRRERQEQGEYSPAERRHQHGNHKLPLGVPVEHTALLHIIHRHGARERAENHHTVKRNIDDAATLGKNAGKRHDQKRHGTENGFL